MLKVPRADVNATTDDEVVKLVLLEPVPYPPPYPVYTEVVVVC